MEYTYHYLSPLGGITLAGDGDALVGLWFDGQKYFGHGLDACREPRFLPVFRETERWLDLYFVGQEPGFTPPLRPRGTAFQQAVWRLLLTVPYGQTVTYGELASKLPRASAQAVGGAVGRNPISLIIPCHRVVGADGRLTGYAGGVDKKAMLLRLENADARKGGLRP